MWGGDDDQETIAVIHNLRKSIISVLELKLTKLSEDRAEADFIGLVLENLRSLENEQGDARLI